MRGKALPVLKPLEETLLLVLHAEPDERQRARLDTLLGEPDFDWWALWRFALAQHVEPLVAYTITTREDPAIPADLRATAQERRKQVALHNMTNQRELERIARACASAGIPVVPLKGTTLTLRVFGALDRRRCGDIDVVVPAERWDAARAIVGSLGYQPRSDGKPGLRQHTFHDVPLERRTAIRDYLLELHRDLSDPRFHALSLDAFWQRRAVDRAGPTPYHELPSDELLVFLAMHVAKHDHGLLRLLVDIDRLVRSTSPLDWARVVDLAREWQVDGQLCHALLRAQSLLDTPVPPGALAGLRPSALERLLVERLAGVDLVLRPPASDRLRTHRFRLAYCLMLRRPGRIARSWWHYFIDPPTDHHPLPSERLVTALRGLSWTGAAMLTSLRASHGTRLPA